MNIAISLPWAKSLVKYLVLAVFLLSLGGFAASALAYNPILNVYSSGGATSVTISGGQPNAPVVINYTPSGSNLPTTITGNTDANGSFTTDVGSVSSQQITATVAGQQVVSSNNGGCTYNCNVGGLTLSQSSVNLNIGQSTMVTASYPIYGGSNIFVSNNTNTNAVSVSVSGNQLTVLGNNSGSANITVCANANSGACATLYVTVGGSNGCTYNCGTISLSQNSVSLNVGQSVAVTAYNYSGNILYIYNNSNPNAVSATVNGSTITLTGQNPGTSSTVTVCGNNVNQCGSIAVTVNGSGSSTNAVNIGDNFFSPSSITVSVGTTVVWHNSGSMTHTVTADNGSFNSGNLSPGASYSLTFNSAGTYTYHCLIHGFAMSGTVVVTGNGSGSLSLSPSSLTLNSGQTGSVTIYSSTGSTGGYTISSGYNASVASAYISGNIVNVTANNSGYTVFSICQNNSSCVSLPVTVNGGGAGTISFSQNNLSLSVGQTAQVTIYGNISFGNNFYVQSNSNPAAVLVNSISGNTLSLTGNAVGSSNLNVCQGTGNICTNLYVTVGGSGGGLLFPGGGNVLGASSFANGTLIKENRTIFIVYKNTKSGFSSAAAFTGLGYKFSNVVNVSNSGLFDTGHVINTSQTGHPWGSWINNAGTVYFVQESGLIPVPDWNTFLNNGGQSNLIVTANAWDFQRPILSPMVFGDFRLR